MKINELQRIVTKEKRRLGQGHGSGRVKTAGRGTKGQNARNKIGYTKYRYSGGSLAFVKSLPFLRGKNKNLSFHDKPVIITFAMLNALAKDTVVDIKTLVDHKLINGDEAKKFGVKILANGTLTVALQVRLPVSVAAKAKIEKAGGRVQEEK